MYGPTAVPTFARFEGYEDHGVEVLCCWDAAGKLIATAINVACPAQEVEGKSAVDADFWHPVREDLRKQYGEDLVVLGWTGAAGDQSPHLMFRSAAEERMRSLARARPTARNLPPNRRGLARGLRRRGKRKTCRCPAGPSG